CLLLVPAQCFAQDKTPSGKDTVSKTSPTKLIELLEQSGYNYSKFANNAWAIPFHGKALANFEVKVVSGDDIAIVFVVVAKKTELKVTPELMRSLLQMNDEADRVKIAIDKEGNLLVRTDVSLRLMDVVELKDNVEQVAAAADEVATKAKPNLIGS